MKMHGSHMEDQYRAPISTLIGQFVYLVSARLTNSHLGTISDSLILYTSPFTIAAASSNN